MDQIVKQPKVFQSCAKKAEHNSDQGLVEIVFLLLIFTDQGLIVDSFVLSRVKEGKGTVVCIKQDKQKENLYIVWCFPCRYTYSYTSELNADMICCCNYRNSQGEIHGDFLLHLFESK